MSEVLTMPTQEQILARYNARKSGDPLGFEVGEYVDYLEFPLAKQFLKEGVTEQEWNEARAQTKPPLDAIKDYMAFAFGKAHGQRGISANRSILHIIAWVWLTGDEAYADELDREYQTNYRGYGLSILRSVCAHYGWDPKEHGDY